MIPCLAVLFFFFFFSTVVIVVIIYHYSGRERKIVSTDGMGAVCGACCNSWVSLQDVGMICLNEHAHAEAVLEMQSIRHIHIAVGSVKVKIVFIDVGVASVQITSRLNLNS